jgi:hypothetical protein
LGAPKVYETSANKGNSPRADHLSMRSISEIFCRCLLSRTGVIVLALLAELIGCAEKVEHDPATAAAKAEEFARVAFVHRDAERSYDLLALGTRRYVSLEKHKEVIARLHPKGYPNAVEAGESEPMPGEKAIYIFLAGQNTGERFYYRFTMEGTATTGYRVLQFDRSKGPKN